MKRRMTPATAAAMIVLSIVVAVPCFAGKVHFPTSTEILEREGISLEADRLIAALSHERPSVRRAAATIMGDLSLREAVPALQVVLDDEYSGARHAAAGSLLRMGYATGLPVLERALQGKDKFEMAQAATELIAAGDDRALDRLISRLETPDDDDGRIPVVVTIAGHRIFPKRAKQVRAALIHILLADPLSDARSVAASALAEDEHPSVLPAFRAALAKETDRVIRGTVQGRLAREAAHDQDTTNRHE